MYLGLYLYSCLYFAPLFCSGLHGFWPFLPSISPLFPPLFPQCFWMLSIDHFPLLCFSCLHALWRHFMSVVLNGYSCGCCIMSYLCSLGRFRLGLGSGFYSSSAVWVCVVGQMFLGFVVSLWFLAALFCVVVDLASCFCTRFRFSTSCCSWRFAVVLLRPLTFLFCLCTCTCLFVCNMCLRMLLSVYFVCLDNSFVF